MIYDNLDNAAAAALFMLSLQQDPKREHIGALFNSGSGFDRSQTLLGSGSHARGTLSLGGPLAALFHNHPGPERSSEKFSDDDKAQARRLGKPSYISTPSGALLRFDPATGKTEDVLAEFPMEEFRAYLMRSLLGRASNDPRGLVLMPGDKPMGLLASE